MACCICCCGSAYGLPIMYPAYSSWRMRSPLYRAARKGNPEQVRQLLKRCHRHGADHRYLLQHLVMSSWNKNRREMLELLLSADFYWAQYLNQFFNMALCFPWNNYMVARYLKGAGATMPPEWSTCHACMCLATCGLCLPCCPGQRYACGCLSISPLASRHDLIARAPEQVVMDRRLGEALPQLGQEKFDVFLSHDWGDSSAATGAHGLNNHQFVAKVKARLQRAGFATWFDEDQLDTNVLGDISRGIDNSKCMVVFLTERYMNKVNSDPTHRDACRHEFCYATQRLPSRMIPVVRDPKLLRVHEWKGIIGTHLNASTNLYIDMTTEAKMKENMGLLIERIAVCIREARLAEGGIAEPASMPKVASHLQPADVVIAQPVGGWESSQ